MIIDPTTRSNYTAADHDREVQEVMDAFLASDPVPGDGIELQDLQDAWLIQHYPTDGAIWVIRSGAAVRWHWIRRWATFHHHRDGAVARRYRRAFPEDQERGRELDERLGR